MKRTDKPWISRYDEGVPAEIDIPDLTLVDLFRQAVKSRGDSTCIIYDAEEMTYQQVDDFSDRVARFLLANGLKKGERVGLLLPNTPAFVLSYYGILKAGGIVMALNPAYRPVEIERLASESGMRILILPDSSLWWWLAQRLVCWLLRTSRGTSCLRIIMPVVQWM